MIAGVLDWSRPPLPRPSAVALGLGIIPPAAEGWGRHCGPGVVLAACPGPTAAPCQSRGLANARRCAAVDGVLYNRHQLATALGLDFTGGGTDEAALILAGYRRWGPAVLDRLLGDFAFAVYDERMGALFAAVDPFGLRPFYYATGEESFAFASRVGQLEAFPWVGDAVDGRTVVSFLADSGTSPEATFNAKVRQLPPGHCLTARAGEFCVRRYWRPGGDGGIGCADAEEILRGSRNSFATLPPRVCLDPRGRLGILMSGGFDSIAVAGVIADIYRSERLPGPSPVVISGRFGSLPCDESEYIDAARAG